jgi:hypothetical protein
MPIGQFVHGTASRASPQSKCKPDRHSDHGSANVRLENGDSEEYRGSRSLDKLKTFASKAIKPYVHSLDSADIRAGLLPIKFEDFEQIISTDEAFFLYLQNFETSLADLVRTHQPS